MQFNAVIFVVPLQSGVPHFPHYHYIENKFYDTNIYIYIII